MIDLVTVNKIPLADQQARVCQEQVRGIECTILCAAGQKHEFLPPAAEAPVRILVATAGAFGELVKKKKCPIPLNQISVLVVDEAHQALNTKVVPKSESINSLELGADETCSQVASDLSGSYSRTICHSGSGKGSI